MSATQRFLSEASQFFFNQAPVNSFFTGMPNNFFYAQPMNDLGYLSMGSWRSPSLYLPVPPINYYGNGLRPGPYYSYDEPLIACGPSDIDAYAPGALWNLNWQFRATDVSINPAQEGITEKSIMVKIGQTIGVIFKNTEAFEVNAKWDLDASVLNESIVEKIGFEHFPLYWYMNSYGKPDYRDAHDQWIFKAKSKGNTTIKFDYSDIQGSGTHHVEIKVIVIN